MDHRKVLYFTYISVQTQIIDLQDQINNFKCTCAITDLYNLPDDYTYENQSFGSFFYKFYDRMDWNSAKTTCEGDGASLLVPRSIEENNFFAFLIETHEEMWLGINDIEIEGEFVDNDGKNITFQNWNDGEPNDYMRREDVVVIRTNDGLWNDQKSNNKRRTLCVLFT